jgi:hypothetical protein
VENQGLERARQCQRRDVCMYNVHMYQCINELTLNSSNFTLHYNYYKVSFETLHYKRVFDTEAMNGYHCFNFTEKLYYEG